MEWTKEQEKILKKYYPTIGTKVQMFLPDKTLNAIDHKVRNLGIKYGLVQEGLAGYFDIESSGLRADFAIMYTWYIKVAGEDKFYHGQITQEELMSGEGDKNLLIKLIDTLKLFKRIYTYYGTRFDIPFTRSRCLSHGLDFLPYGLVEHKDIYYLARRVLCIHSNRLECVCDLLGIVGKNHLEPKVWIAANTGKKEAIDYIAGHNKLDVIILEKVHKRLQEYELNPRRFM